MRKWPGLALGLGALLLVGAYWADAPPRERASAAQKWKIIVPHVARDSAPSPSPTQPRSTEREVLVIVEMEALEISLQEGGGTLVTVSASARTALPGRLDPPVTVAGTATVASHPRDICSWPVSMANPNFSMTLSQPEGMDLSVKVDFTGPEWHYLVDCPGGNKPFRVPAGNVERTLTGWLGLVFPGGAGPGGMTIKTPAQSGNPDCLTRKGLERGSTGLATATITVYVYAPPCLLPTFE